MRRANDPAWLEQQYDNRARVPDHASHFQKWAAASAHTRAHAPCVLDVRYGDEARFLAVDGDYIVGVRTNEVGVLVSTAREPAPLFGGDAVIGVDDTDTECPTLEDPVRTLLADGTAVDTGVLSPLRGHSGELRAALLKPLLFALGGLVLLVLLKQLLFSFGRETRRRAGVARRGTPSTPRARRGWSQPT